MPKTEQNIAAAFRHVAEQLAAEWDKGARSGAIDVHDLVEILERIADRIAK